jgi:uncharacterized damage-inducible protein DinB
MNPTAIAPIMIAGLLFATALTATNARQDATPEERQKALAYIEESNRGLYDAVRGLSDAQWNFKPGPDRWSIAEVVEHISVIQDIVIGVLAKMSTAPLAPEGRDVARIDAEILTKVLDRTEKFKSPPQALPTGRWTPEAALAHFKETNQALRVALETTHDLRAHIVNHPVLGPWDSYEWIIGAAGHTKRHTLQILEVKSDAEFPAK